MEIKKLLVVDYSLQKLQGSAGMSEFPVSFEVYWRIQED